MVRDIAVLTASLAFFICVLLFGPELLPEGWGWVAIVVGVWLGFGCAAGIFQTLAHRKVHNKMALAFPGYRGKRVPICAFLAYSGPQGEIEGNSNKDYALGISPSTLFLIHVSDNSGPEAGGTLLNGLKGEPLGMRRDEIVDVSVVEFSDETIAENARDKRDATERIAESMALRLFGGSLGKIVPFAAVIVVSTKGSGGEACFLFGIPTEIDHHVLALLEQAGDGVNAAGAAIAGVIKDVAVSGTEEAADGVLGEGMTEIGGGMVGIIATPGMPAGSTDGAIARRVARKVAQRIRGLGLRLGTVT